MDKINALSALQFKKQMKDSQNFTILNIPLHYIKWSYIVNYYTDACLVMNFAQTTTVLLIIYPSKTRTPRSPQTSLEHDNGQKDIRWHL